MVFLIPPLELEDGRPNPEHKVSPDVFGRLPLPLLLGIKSSGRADGAPGEGTGFLALLAVDVALNLLVGDDGELVDAIDWTIDAAAVVDRKSVV